MEIETKQKISDFIVENFLFGKTQSRPTDDESLIEKGIIDSTGILELIQFIESAFNITIDDSETIPSNLDSIENISRFVLEKIAVR